MIDGNIKKENVNGQNVTNGSVDSKIAVITLIVSNVESAETINRVLHEYGGYVIGRMGLPYAQKNVNVICVAIDAPLEIINSISGKLGMIKNVTSKVLTTK